MTLFKYYLNINFRSLKLWKTPMFDAEENIFSLKKKIWCNIRFESITFKNNPLKKVVDLFHINSSFLLLLLVYQKHDHIFTPVYDN